jgi:hypothetical protein
MIAMETNSFAKIVIIKFIKNKNLKSINGIKIIRTQNSNLNYNVTLIKKHET